MEPDEQLAPIVRKKRKTKSKVSSPEQRLSKDLEKASRALSMDELACAHLCSEYTMEEAAKTLGWDAAAVREVWNRPAVQRYLERAQEIFLHKLASSKIKLLKKVEATPTHVMARLMALAMKEPEETKFNIDGQVKALQTLGRMLGMYDETDPLKNKSPEELKALIAGAHAKVIDGAKPAETATQ